MMRCATVVEVRAWLSGGGGGWKSPYHEHQHQHLLPFPCSCSPLTLTLTIKPKPLLTSLKPHPPLLVFAVNNNNNNKEVVREQQGDKQEEEQQKPTGSGSNEEDVNDNNDSKNKQRRPIFLSFINWNSLLDPDPDNVLALGLTGLLTWASLQVLWQLLFISFAIFVAALKYSFIAALLLFILITLL